ncbi:unnamed protein product [Nippostrongylus brasiliensis]|uniref:START domain-containing protein n=1 Tax=Nippostrongylus brasiliensis TaxID=27835 RepID=A0A0N4Y0V9_NIPBR|nr:unnamed protein product [Nippostrongylus brasiliensis]
MSTTVKLLDIEDTSTNSQYGMGLRNTAHAFVEALKIFDDAKRADRKDWKQKAEHKGDKCFNKHFPIGKVYYLKKTFNLDMDNLFTNHWNEYTTSEVVVIKGRDFVVCRMWRKVGDSYVVCATSFETDIAVAPKKKRGWVNVCAGKFTPLNSDPTKSLVEYLVSVDLKDKITPKADARNAFKYVEEEIAKKAHD